MICIHADTVVINNYDNEAKCESSSSEQDLEESSSKEANLAPESGSKPGLKDISK